jgi:DNA topoisomerase II
MLFNKQDEPLYTQQFDEGMPIEPEYYIPVLPMVLVNGCQGIGTGWSTKVQSYNPYDIIENINRYINGTEMVEMTPFYRGFEGKIEKKDQNSYISKGIYEVKDNKLIITELPVGVWTDKYKEFLESICIDTKTKSKKQIIRYYNSYCTDTKINFELCMDKDFLHKMNKDKIEQTFHLTSAINTTNMVLYNSQNVITKYDNVLDIIKDFCDVRKQFYNTRKHHIIDGLNKDISLLDVKIKFIYEFIEGIITIIKVKKDDIIKQLQSKDYPEIDGNYDYLLKMPIYNLSDEKIEDFESKMKLLKTELELIKSNTECDLWRTDIGEIKKELIKYGYGKSSKIKITKPKKIKN